jgi:hypothetical protein
MTSLFSNEESVARVAIFTSVFVVDGVGVGVGSSPPLLPQLAMTRTATINK